MDTAEIITTATAEQIAEARDWASDCLQLVDRTVSAERAIAYVQREYPGGWSAFVAEVCVPALAEPATVHGVTCSGCRATETGGVDAVRNGWRRVTGRLMCRRCATGFPVWMRDRI